MSKFTTYSWSSRAFITLSATSVDIGAQFAPAAWPNKVTKTFARP